MDIDKAKTFLKTHHRAVMATYRRDGRPQMSPVGVGVDAAGRVIMSSREPAYKVRNLRRDPRVSVCVFSDEFYGEWVQIDGEAEIISMPDALEDLVDYYKRVVGEHPDWDDYRAAMAREQRVLVRITIERAGPDRMG
ncbi:MAG TPA: PPOX class F420-dependent oxidoreductase [Anaerolineae bacterium]|jgi:PPOX class probable F420-dependent enzyme